MATRKESIEARYRDASASEPPSLNAVIGRSHPSQRHDRAHAGAAPGRRRPRPARRLPSPITAMLQFLGYSLLLAGGHWRAVCSTRNTRTNSPATS